MISPRTTGPARSTATAAIVLAAGLLLSGCGLLPTPAPPTVTASEPAPQPSSSPSADGQTQAQQCAELMGQVQALTADVARIGELLSTNPFAVPQLLDDVSSRVGELQLRVTDPALLERIGEIQTGWDALVADARASLESGDTGGIERAMTGLGELGEQVAALQEFCAGTA